MLKNLRAFSFKVYARTYTSKKRKKFQKIVQEDFERNTKDGKFISELFISFKELEKIKQKSGRIIIKRGQAGNQAYAKPAWLNILIEKGYEIFCGFENDEIGDILANKMIRFFPIVKRLRPTKHDWDEILVSKYKKS